VTSTRRATLLKVGGALVIIRLAMLGLAECVASDPALKYDSKSTLPAKPGRCATEGLEVNQI
jgi:hypothetical protein